MNYNCNHIIEYINLDEEEMNDAYRADFLKCFNCESYDNTIDTTITELYNITHILPEFSELYSQVRVTYSILNNDELCIVYLFSYDHLHEFHTIISSYINNNNDIRRENINN